MSKPGRLREAMPETAAFVDAMREAFGREMIDDIIARGMAGEPVFHSVEGGVEIGTAPGWRESPDGQVLPWSAGRRVQVGDMVLGAVNVKLGRRHGKAT